MTVIVLLLLGVPLAAALVSLVLPGHAAGAVSAVSGIASFCFTLALIPAASRHDLSPVSFVRIDALSLVFLMATAFGYACVSVYSIGYLRTGTHGQGTGFHAEPGYTRWFWTGLNLFAWSMLVAPAMSNLAVLWVAIEVTTIVSALLVALERTPTAAEAAWKYVVLASAGLAIALLGTIAVYYAGAHVLGHSYDLAFAPLLHVAARLPRTAVRLAFVLAVLGYGTKVGLVPVHSWLPDAHSEAPTPVSALLSGSLLGVSFYAILRFYQVAAGTLGPRFPRDVLLVFGVASLLLAALYLLDQRDYKRLLAYSSIEHMGILAIGVSFGAPIALAGVLLHVLAHAAAKSNAFMGAGVLTRKFAGKRIAAVNGGMDLLPWSGPLFLAAVLALSAMPPFGIFRSEFYIVAGGLSTSSGAVTAILVIGVTVAFLGLTLAANRMLLAPRRTSDHPPRDELLDQPRQMPRGEPSTWMVIPVVAGVIALIVLGLHPPAELTALLNHAVAALRGPA